MADVLDLAGRLKVTYLPGTDRGPKRRGLTRHLTALRVREFEVATSGGIWVAIRGLTLEPSGAEGNQLGRPVKACPTSSQAAADARQRPELQCLNPQSDRGCCKENQVLGTYG